MTETRKYTKNRQSWGGTRKLKSGRWQASYRVGGVRYTAPMTYTAKADAEGFLARTRVAVEKGSWRDPKMVNVSTFDRYARIWVAQRISKGKPLAPKTAAEYLRQIDKGIGEEFSTDRLPAITPVRVRTWHAKRTGKAGATAAGAEARLLHAIMSTAVGDKIIEDNPVPPPLTRTSTGKESRPPTPEELAVLVAHIDPRFKFGLLLAAFGGLRLGEWKALRRRDLVLQDGRYSVSVTRQAQHIPGTGWVVSPPKSRHGVRVVTMPTHLTPEVEAHLSRTGQFPDSLLFPPNGSSTFVHDSTFRIAWDRARDAAGVRTVVREHDLRDFAASWKRASGADAYELRDFLGHANIRTAEAHYVHMVNDRAAELADRMPVLPEPHPSNVVRL